MFVSGLALKLCISGFQPIMPEDGEGLKANETNRTLVFCRKTRMEFSHLLHVAVANMLASAYYLLIHFAKLCLWFT